MKTISNTDPVAELRDRINGACNPQILAGINGNLPKWWAASGLRAVPTGKQPTLAVFVSADGPLPGIFGAKVEMDPPCDLLQLADQLAEQLRAKIRRAGPPVVRFALAPGARQPMRQTPGAAGYDLHALAAARIDPGRIARIATGVYLELPPGYEAQVRPRSGWSSRGMWVPLGTIDSDYRGDVGLICANLGPDPVTIDSGDRVAQLVIARVDTLAWEQVDAADLAATDRGTAGFGSTGR